MDPLDREDLEETLVYERRNADRIQRELKAQIARSTAVYGDRRNWPASSEMGVRAIEDDERGCDERIAEIEKILEEED